MKTCIAQLQSITPYSQSAALVSEKKKRERDVDYEMRVWRERIHADEKTGQVYIPPMALKFALDAASKKEGRKIPGAGQRTYSGVFLSGVICAEGPALGIHRDDVQGQWLFVSATGARGIGKRVRRMYPIIPAWSAIAVFHILDDAITEDVFSDTLRMAGLLVGIGRFRPEVGGMNGRFAVKGLEWKEGAVL